MRKPTGLAAMMGKQARGSPRASLLPFPLPEKAWTVRPSRSEGWGLEAHQPGVRAFAFFMSWMAKLSSWWCNLLAPDRLRSNFVPPTNGITPDKMLSLCVPRSFPQQMRVIAVPTLYGCREDKMG